MLNPAIQCANSSSISLPAGHYSHVCIGGGFVMISGQLPINPEGQPLADQSFEKKLGKS